MEALKIKFARERIVRAKKSKALTPKARADLQRDMAIRMEID